MHNPLIENNGLKNLKKNDVYSNETRDNVPTVFASPLSHGRSLTIPSFSGEAVGFPPVSSAFQTETTGDNNCSSKT